MQAFGVGLHGSLLPGEIPELEPDLDPAAVPWWCRIHRDGSAGSVPACSTVHVSRPMPLSAVTAGIAAGNGNFK